MERQNYYDILGVSVKASAEELISAKNALAKQYHPDANLKNGVDTTECMQSILEAYQILSNPQTRAEYDREISGRTRDMQTYDLKHTEEDAKETSSFVTYWRAAGSLYEITQESNALFRRKDTSSQLFQLSIIAIRHVLTLRNANIPEYYWYPDIMNWLLFAWYKNQNATIAHLLTLYDEHLQKSLSLAEKLRLQTKSFRYQHSVKRLLGA